MMAEGEATTERPYEFGNDFVIAYNKDGILSVIMQDYSYTGGAHGMTARKGYTFSLADGKLLQLSDVLKANPNYKKFLNADLKKKSMHFRLAKDSANLKSWRQIRIFM